MNLWGKVDNVGCQAIFADRAGQADTVTRAGVHITTCSMMESKGCWLGHRPETRGETHCLNPEGEEFKV